MQTEPGKPVFHFTLHAGTEPGTPLEAPRRVPLLAKLIVVGMFAAFATVWVVQFNNLSLHKPGGVTDLMMTLFSLFWLMGWSVGVLLLAVLTVFLLLYREASYLAGGKLVNVMNVGPFAMRGEYELARMQNLRVAEEANGKTAKILFEYGGKACTLGNNMLPDVAARNLKVLQDAVAAADVFAPLQVAAAPAAPVPVRPVSHAEAERRGLPWPSMASLVAANLIPLYMVLSGEWTLEQVILLFWAESGVIGFYTLLKMAVVARWWSIFPGVFFLGHFGGFMAMHFLFIYMLFLRGALPGTLAPAALDELVRLFAPLQLALLALVISHGISFVANFAMRREYEGARVQSLMTAPYGRIIAMQLTLILGGWVVMWLHDPAPALAMLIVFKVIADLSGHHGEHERAKGSASLSF